MNKEFTPPLKVAFVERWHEYGDVYSYVFRPEEKFEFIAGQNVRLVIPHLKEEEGRRSFSLASPPHERNLRFTLHTGSGSPYKQAFESLTKGDEVHLVKVKGKTMLPSDTSIPVVLIAGGVGITPFRSILLDVVEKNFPTKIKLIHVSSEKYLYKDELSKLPFDQKRIGRADVNQAVSDVIESVPNAMYFVVGSPSFLEAIEEILKKNNIPEDSIRISRFTGYKDLFD